MWQLQKYSTDSTLPCLGSNFTHKVAAMSNRKLTQEVATVLRLRQVRRKMLGTRNLSSIVLYVLSSSTVNKT